MPAAELAKQLARFKQEIDAGRMQSTVAQTMTTTDGRCGAGAARTRCTFDLPYCSEHGWCGKTDAHKGQTQYTYSPSSAVIGAGQTSSAFPGGGGWWVVQQLAIFNVNDNWSEKRLLRAAQLKELKAFWRQVYPEVPWFEDRRYADGSGQTPSPRAVAAAAKQDREERRRACQPGEDRVDPEHGCESFCSRAGYCGHTDPYRLVDCANLH